MITLITCAHPAEPDGQPLELALQALTRFALLERGWVQNSTPLRGVNGKHTQHMCLWHTLRQERRAVRFAGHRQTRVAIAPSALKQRGTRSRTKKSSFTNTTIFAGLVAFARGLHPIPFRTRPLNPSAPMVLWLKPRESRSPPGLPRLLHPSLHTPTHTTPPIA